MGINNATTIIVNLKLSNSSKQYKRLFFFEIRSSACENIIPQKIFENNTAVCSIGVFIYNL